MDQQTQVATTQKTDLSVSNSGIDIDGLEEVSPSIIPVPWLKLVQPTSTNIDTVNGKDAEPGSFYYSNTKEALTEVKFAMLKAKQGTKEFERDGKLVKTPKIAILGYDLVNERMFVLSLAVTSFSSFGKLVSQFKQNKITNTYSYPITISSTKTENDKGKYYVANFELGEKLPDEKIKELFEMKESYGIVLNRKVPEDVDIAVEVVAKDLVEDSTVPTESQEVTSEELPF